MASRVMSPVMSAVLRSSSAAAATIAGLCLEGGSEDASGMDAVLCRTCMHSGSPEHPFFRVACSLVETADLLSAVSAGSRSPGACGIDAGPLNDMGFDACFRAVSVIQGLAHPGACDDDHWGGYGMPSGWDSPPKLLSDLAGTTAICMDLLLKTVPTADRFLGPQSPLQCRRVMAWLVAAARQTASVAFAMSGGACPCDGPVAEHCCEVHGVAMGVVAMLCLPPGFSTTWSGEDVTGAYYGVTVAEFPDGARYVGLTGDSHSVFDPHELSLMRDAVLSSRRSDQESVSRLAGMMHRAAAGLVRDLNPDRSVVSGPSYADLLMGAWAAANSAV